MMKGEFNMSMKCLAEGEERSKSQKKPSITLVVTESSQSV